MYLFRLINFEPRKTNCRTIDIDTRKSAECPLPSGPPLLYLKCCILHTRCGSSRCWLVLFLHYEYILNILRVWARICRPFKGPRNRFPPWRAGTTTLIVVLAGKLHRLVESISRNRFLGSLNFYKYGLWSENETLWQSMPGMSSFINRIFP